MANLGAPPGLMAPGVGAVGIPLHFAQAAEGLIESAANTAEEMLLAVMQGELGLPLGVQARRAEPYGTVLPYSCSRNGGSVNDPWRCVGEGHALRPDGPRRYPAEADEPARRNLVPGAEAAGGGIKRSPIMRHNPPWEVSAALPAQCVGT